MHQGSIYQFSTRSLGVYISKFQKFFQSGVIAKIPQKSVFMGTPCISKSLGGNHNPLPLTKSQEIFGLLRSFFQLNEHLLRHFQPFQTLIKVLWSISFHYSSGNQIQFGLHGATTAVTKFQNATRLLISCTNYLIPPQSPRDLHLYFSIARTSEKDLR